MVRRRNVLYIHLITVTKNVTKILILTNLLFRKRLRNKVTSVPEMFDCSQTFSVDLLEFS